jgi:sigma-B regulation protein RsbU (phosphoserine phosphatase)
MAQHPMRILVVDDDQLSRRLLTRSLEGFGFDVVECRDGVEALQLLENGGPAMLVLDYQMPELNGAQICELIRQFPDPAVAQIPILMLTAHSNADHEVECLRAGANDFVTKPVNTAILKARIDTHLRLHALREQLMEQKGELEKWRHNHELDLEAARLTQQAILPQRLPKLQDWDFATHFHPVIQVGGDIYDWVKADDGSLLVWISDATGHGASAALQTTLSKFLFRHAAAERASAGGVMEQVNKDYQSIFKGRASFMTAACMILPPGAGGITFCGAGHPPLLIVRGDGRVEGLPSSGPPLGLDGGARCTDELHELRKGDAVLLYTDGLYEVADVRGERLSQRELAKLLTPADDLSAQEWLAGIVEKVSAHADGEAFPDDVAAFAAVRK